MKPIQLTIQAFGSYGERAVIDFTKPTQNLFLVTGDTGAGKTTIFDAIVYALYGIGSICFKISIHTFVVRRTAVIIALRTCRA